jgi:hypothetical protein
MKARAFMPAGTNAPNNNPSNRNMYFVIPPDHAALKGSAGTRSPLRGLTTMGSCPEWMEVWRGFLPLHPLILKLPPFLLHHLPDRPLSGQIRVDYAAYK